MSAYQTFKTALNSGEFSDFQNIIMGGTRTLNGPQGGLCFCLDALDNAQFGQPQVPPAPATASDQNATELLEHYWASLLRDIAFADYPSNSIATQAAAELGSQPIDQQQVTYLPNIDYGTNFAEWLNIQDGVDTGLRNQVDPQRRYRRNGRDLAAFTHVDVLYQAYFTAFLVLAGINPSPPAALPSAERH